MLLGCSRDSTPPKSQPRAGRAGAAPGRAQGWGWQENTSTEEKQLGAPRESSPLESLQKSGAAPVLGRAGRQQELEQGSLRWRWGVQTWELYGGDPKLPKPAGRSLQLWRRNCSVVTQDDGGGLEFTHLS